MPDRHPPGDGSVALRGRRRERGVLDSLIEEVRAGRSGALVLRGDAGIGKSALLAYAIEQASDFHLARTTGVQSEMELPFAGLHQLCITMLERLKRLPGPQHDALATAFGLAAGATTDRFLVSLAALALISDAGDHEPTLCVVDDMHWLDAASTEVLAFVARRLHAESVGMVFAVRESIHELAGLPELVVEALPDREARELLQSVIGRPLDERVRERIILEARGNPLALMELPRSLATAELAGGYGLPEAQLSRGLEETFTRRFAALPREAKLLAVLAAAEPLGDSALLWRAAELMGLDASAAEHTTAAGFLEIGATVRFRHPLVRSAVYRTASVAERQEVHGALARATDPRVDPDRRAWHRARATSGPDEAVASELEHAAGRALTRGGMAAAAAFLRRAAVLTLDPALRAQRALSAAQADHMGGAHDEAWGLLSMAQAGPLDELGRARVDLLRAKLALATRRGGDPLLLLLRAAKRLEPLDPRLARETYLDALTAGQFIGRLASNGGVREVAQAALAAPRPERAPTAGDLLLEGLAIRFTGSYAASVPILRQALLAATSETMSREDELRWMWLAGHAAVDLWDDETWTALADRHLKLARDTGAVTVLPLALSTRIAAYAFAGELAAARLLIEEVEATVEAIGSDLAPYGALLLAAWQRREPEASELMTTIVAEVEPRGEGLGITIVHWAAAVLNNGLGRYDDALREAELASNHPEDLGFSNWALVELILAAVRAGERERACAALARLSEMTRTTGTDWGLGIEARSRALMAADDEAEDLYRESIARLSRTRIRVELARAHLQYGEWLRRQRRRIDAREQLRTADEMFGTMGIGAFSPRTSSELRATGQHARQRTDETRKELTAQERQVARLAQEGLSNLEIGSRLFISPRTVEYHLHKVFTKLDIGSRTQLERALPREAVGQAK